MYQDTPIRQFELLGQASLNVSNGLTANVNTYARTQAQCAVYSTFPTSYALERWRGDGANQAQVCFLLKDTAGDAVDDMDGQFRLYGKDSSTIMGGALLVEGDVTAGAAVLGTAASPGTAPVPGVTLTGQWGWADTITLSGGTLVNNIGAWAEPDTGADGIASMWFDLRGFKYFWIDFDCDAGDGTACDDMMAIIRLY